MSDIKEITKKWNNFLKEDSGDSWSKADRAAKKAFSDRISGKKGNLAPAGSFPGGGAGDLKDRKARKLSPIFPTTDKEEEEEELEFRARPNGDSVHGGLPCDEVFWGENRALWREFIKCRRKHSKYYNESQIDGFIRQGSSELFPGLLAAVKAIAKKEGAYLYRSPCMMGGNRKKRCSESKDEDCSNLAEPGCKTVDRGFMQLNSVAFENVTHKEALDPVKNIEAGAKYLLKCLEVYAARGILNQRKKKKDRIRKLSLEEIKKHEKRDILLFSAFAIYNTGPGNAKATFKQFALNQNIESFSTSSNKAFHKYAPAAWRFFKEYGGWGDEPAAPAASKKAAPAAATTAPTAATSSTGGSFGHKDNVQDKELLIKSGPDAAANTVKYTLKGKTHKLGVYPKFFHLNNNKRWAIKGKPIDGAIGLVAGFVRPQPLTILSVKITAGNKLFMKLNHPVLAERIGFITKQQADKILDHIVNKDSDFTFKIMSYNKDDEKKEEGEVEITLERVRNQ